MPKLVPHPDHPPRAIEAIEAEVRCEGSIWHFDYRVKGDVAQLDLPPPEEPVRRDGLWEQSCFECFAACEDKSYREFNFSPSGSYAAYAFDDYRHGQRDAAATVSIETGQAPGEYHLSARLSANLGKVDALALTAVIEEKDGTKSYWALAHPEGHPDFHHPAGFVLPIEDI
ncbi:DOMON-like domain-containing protein [Sphingomicrobium lutaoense]|uniref:DOMON-like domain-containing protein n=1 Tax=Sphingomicrobium lutaoense TaxID=515949 RepID=A0A839YZF7_9SPHN|nr:DOMON-like domain-containing protein [Sphingomicrobium lutaoense]MBB3763708.1 hypothetical protein [Sphingomicrobium lutaoense]